MKIEDCYTDVRRLSTDKELKDLAVAKDLLRLARKVRIQQVPSNLYQISNEEPVEKEQDKIDNKEQEENEQIEKQEEKGEELDKKQELEENQEAEKNQEAENNQEKEELEKKEETQEKKEQNILATASSHEKTPFINDEQVKNIEYIENIKEAEQMQVIYHLLKELVQELGEDENNTIGTFENFEEKVNTNDYSTFTSFLCDTIGEDSVVVRALKSCHQTIIARILHRFRDDGLTFKDVRGSWRIYIRFAKEGKKLTHLSTIHRRKEQMYLRGDDGFNFTNMYRFEWEIESHYDVKKLEVTNVELRLLNIEYGNETEEAQYHEHAAYFLNVFQLSHENKTPERFNMELIAPSTPSSTTKETPTKRKKKKRKKPSTTTTDNDHRKKEWCVVL